MIGHYVCKVFRLEDSFGVMGGRPASMAQFHGINERMVVQFPLSSLGKIKAKEKTLRFLGQRGDYDSSVPVEVKVITIDHRTSKKSLDV